MNGRPRRAKYLVTNEFIRQIIKVPGVKWKTVKGTIKTRTRWKDHPIFEGRRDSYPRDTSGSRSSSTKEGVEPQVLFP